MNETPKGLRLHIGFFGRTNAGKSSFLNLVTGQQTSIVSPVAGTTTDVVRKSMELLPIGPVTLLDTAGLDDESDLGKLRVERTEEALRSADVAVLVLDRGEIEEADRYLIRRASEQNTPLVAVVNKVDLSAPGVQRIAEIRALSSAVLQVSCARAAVDDADRERVVREFKKAIFDVCPESFLSQPALLSDLLPSGAGVPLAVLVVPIDLQAPKGRLILPQVQAIRDALDADAATTVVKEREYRSFLTRLFSPPELVVCDSQVALKAAADTPDAVPLTTFSILMSRMKGDVAEMARGAARLASLRSGDRVLVAEACAHHALEDDIGSVKIPRWLRQYVGEGVSIDHARGRDWPKNLSEYRLIIHCGACTLTRREMLWRLAEARERGVPMTNYGMAISVLQGVAERTLSPFPLALDAYRSALKDRL